jgi:hypothetical protein
MLHRRNGGPPQIRSMGCLELPHWSGTFAIRWKPTRPRAYNGTDRNLCEDGLSGQGGRMVHSVDIDGALAGWPYQPGVISARLVRAGDGRDVLQMRIEMGMLQMEISGRPDGTEPSGRGTYLDCLIQEVVRCGSEFQMSDEHRFEADREFLQFYHRRICWMALREFDRAVRDADHTLALMDFVRDHSSDEDWMLSHEQYRPFVLFHRAEAASLATLQEAGPESAIEELERGLERLRGVYRRAGGDELLEKEEMVAQLVELKEWIRQQYDVGRTLGEQLSEAVAAEQYELAARLRDEIASRRSKQH